MNLGAILIGFAILVVTVPFVINPLVNEHKKLPAKVASLKKNGKSQEKDVLAAIRDLDFDFQTGKVTQEDYETVRTQLVLEAATNIQMKKQEDEKIEEMIRARSKTVKLSVKCEKCGRELGPLDRFCPTCGVPAKNQAGSDGQASQISCPSCGKSVKEGDLFCTGCGMKLSKQTVTENAPSEN